MLMYVYYDSTILCKTIVCVMSYVEFLEFDFNGLYIIIDAYIPTLKVHVIHTYCFTFEVSNLHTLWL